MTIAPRNRRMLRRLDILGLYAGDRLVDLLSRRQLIRALAQEVHDGGPSTPQRRVADGDTNLAEDRQPNRADLTGAMR
jgi:hypothetical protein